MELFESFDPSVRRVMAIAPEHFQAVRNRAELAGALFTARKRQTSEGFAYYLVEFHGDSLRKAADALNARRRRSASQDVS